MFEGYKVVFVEDDLPVRVSLTQTLELEGFTVQPCRSAEEALPHLQPGAQVILITDVRLPGMDGCALLAHVQATDPGIPVILITAHGDVAMAVQSMRAGAYDFIEKPFAPERLLDVARRALDLRTLRHSADALRTQLQRASGIEAALLGQSPAMQQLRRQVLNLAGTSADVLIVGETGTGKELIARHIHHCSGRRGPFLAVNCGAFTEQLVEAELFGHEAGAYTGATSARAGWFEAATDGTLFLDEVGDLPPAVQVKLLRVLQERQVVRIGSRKPIDVRVRLVAATNVRLEQAVAAGHFRADLYYRLSVATLQLSNLAQRPGDIIALAEHFIGVYSRRLNLSDVRLSHEARDALLAYPWPGNIRELENVIHYALIVCRDGRIAREDLQLHAVARPGLATPIAVATTASEAAAESSADEALRRVFERLFDEAPQALQARVEEVLIRSAFSHCHHNQVHTAALLGITRNVLRTQLKRLGLLAPPRAERLPASTALPGSAGAHAALRAVA